MNLRNSLASTFSRAAAAAALAIGTLTADAKAQERNPFLFDAQAQKVQSLNEGAVDSKTINARYDRMFGSLRAHMQKADSALAGSTPSFLIYNQETTEALKILRESKNDPYFVAFLGPQADSLLSEMLILSELQTRITKQIFAATTALQIPQGNAATNIPAASAEAIWLKLNGVKQTAELYAKRIRSDSSIQFYNVAALRPQHTLNAIIGLLATLSEMRTKNIFPAEYADPSFDALNTAKIQLEAAIKRTNTAQESRGSYYFWLTASDADRARIASGENLPVVQAGMREDSREAYQHVHQRILNLESAAKAGLVNDSTIAQVIQLARSLQTLNLRHNEMSEQELTVVQALHNSALKILTWLPEPTKVTPRNDLYADAHAALLSEATKTKTLISTAATSIQLPIAAAAANTALRYVQKDAITASSITAALNLGSAIKKVLDASPDVKANLAALDSLRYKAEVVLARMPKPASVRQNSTYETAYKQLSIQLSRLMKEIEPHLKLVSKAK